MDPINKTFVAALEAQMAVLFVTVFFIFPIVFKPGVEPPTQLPFGSPFSMAVRISNQNPFTLLTDVEYSCEVSKLTLATGADVTDAKASSGNPSKI
jgi:hypothetical protein